MTVLDDARQHLFRRYQHADQGGDYETRQVLDPLADIADYLCRIGDNWDSSHYHADKAGSLLAAALRLQVRTLERYADTQAGASNTDPVVDLGDMLSEVLDSARSCMWDLARLGVIEPDSRFELTDKLDELRRWVADFEPAEYGEAE